VRGISGGLKGVLNVNYNYAQFRVNEAIRPSLSPVLRGLGDAASPITGQPRYFDINGNTITKIACGQPYMFEVPGYTNISLRVTKDGVETFNGPFVVPMAPYTSNCDYDPGQYEATASDLSTGQVLGKTTLTITGGSIFSSLSPTTWLLIGSAALLLFRRKRG